MHITVMHTDPDLMLRALAEVAKEARLAGTKKRSHYAAAADLDQSAITRFEQGERWPKNPGAIVAGYAHVLKVDPLDLWERAVKRARGVNRPQSATDAPHRGAFDAAVDEVEDPGRGRRRVRDGGGGTNNATKTRRAAR